MQTLRSILASLRRIPGLKPVPREHVLAKTFYLLKDFPGRFNSGQLWVEALLRQSMIEEQASRPARSGDGVSSIIITSNDFAGGLGDAPGRTGPVTALGIPAVNFGPGDALLAHKDNEHVEADAIRECLRALRTWLGG